MKAIVADPIVVLRAFVARYDTQNDAAAALQITPSYLSELLMGRRTFSERMAARIGLEWRLVRKSDAS